MKSSKPEVSVIKMYSAREEIYPREIQGRYASLRWLCVWLTQLAFYGLPWLSWNGRQALLFDLAARKFYIFGIVLWPQDFIYLAALLIICAYLLFLVTAIAGRVWCGFACPQTVYTEIFLWIERVIEGKRSARMRLDKQAASFAKFGRKSAKHLAWGAVALWTGFTFVGYFTPIRELAMQVFALTLGPWQMFWVLFYSFATYGNAGWLREQVCKYMCPYARFQSSMFDKDTLIISYDQQRGEPRGMPTKHSAAAGTTFGACIDCSMCVQVCPAGIDIRDGLQYECIGCAACVDACNSVMDKIGSARGLIRYTTDNALANKLLRQQNLQHDLQHDLQQNLQQDLQQERQQVQRRALRPRVLIYGLILSAIVIAFFTTLSLRTPLKLDVIRDRGAMGREVEDGMIENVYRLQIMNTGEQPQRYKISVAGIETLALATSDEVALAATETRAVPVRVRLAPGQGEPGSNEISFNLQGMDDDSLHVTEHAVFFVPR